METATLMGRSGVLGRPVGLSRGARVSSTHSLSGSPSQAWLHQCFHCEFSTFIWESLSAYWTRVDPGALYLSYVENSSNFFNFFPCNSLLRHSISLHRRVFRGSRLSGDVPPQIFGTFYWDFYLSFIDRSDFLGNLFSDFQKCFLRLFPRSALLWYEIRP